MKISLISFQQKTESTSADLEEIFGLTATAEDIFKLMNKSNKQWVSFKRMRDPHF